MPRARPKILKAANRPKIPIDWKIVDRCLQSACSGVEIAGLLGCHADTLYDRCLQEKGITFTAYSAEKRSNGDALLKLEQMALALTGKGGDKTMLVWLGKQRLGQREDPHYESTFNGQLASILDLFKNVRTQEDFEQKNKDTNK
jgi:hypothetical protein